MKLESIFPKVYGRKLLLKHSKVLSHERKFAGKSNLYGSEQLYTMQKHIIAVEIIN